MLFLSGLKPMTGRPFGEDDLILPGLFSENEAWFCNVANKRVS